MANRRATIIILEKKEKQTPYIHKLKRAAEKWPPKHRLRHGCAATNSFSIIVMAIDLTDTKPKEDGKYDKIGRRGGINSNNKDKTVDCSTEIPTDNPATRTSK